MQADERSTRWWKWTLRPYCRHQSCRNWTKCGEM